MIDVVKTFHPIVCRRWSTSNDTSTTISLGALSNKLDGTPDEQIFFFVSAHRIRCEHHTAKRNTPHHNTLPHTTDADADATLTMLVCKTKR